MDAKLAVVFTVFFSFSFFLFFFFLRLLLFTHLGETSEAVFSAFYGQSSVASAWNNPSPWSIYNYNVHITTYIIQYYPAGYIDNSPAVARLPAASAVNILRMKVGDLQITKLVFAANFLF